MRALEDRQHAIDERDCAIVQLASRLEAKAAAEVRAAVLADDLAVLARKYDMLSRGWMLHASVAVPGRELERAADSPERQPPLEQQHEQQPQNRDASSLRLDGGGRVMLAFTTGLGGKRPTRDAVLENITMRERLLATEWFGDDILRESMSREAVPRVPMATPPRPKGARRRLSPRRVPTSSHVEVLDDD
jgi:hypothetical protein